MFNSIFLLEYSKTRYTIWQLKNIHITTTLLYLYEETANNTNNAKKTIKSLLIAFEFNTKRGKVFSRI